jgi:hypothetical protein
MKTKKIQLSSITLNKLDTGWNVVIQGTIDSNSFMDRHAVSTTKQLLKRLEKLLNKKEYL